MITKRDIDNFERTSSQFMVEEKLDKFLWNNEDDFIIEDNIMEYYNNLVEKVAELYKKMNFIDHIDIANIYNLMLWDGMFSHGARFKFREYDKYDNIYLLGANVMFGQAACVNTATFFTDILKKMGFEAYTLTCRLSSNIPKEKDERYFVPSKPGFRELVTLVLNELMCGSNHAVTGVLVDGRLDIIDSINGDFANLSKYNEIEYVKNHRKAKLDQNNLLYLNLGMDSIKLRRIFLDSLANETKLTKGEIRSSKIAVKDFYEENQIAFDWIRGYLASDVTKVNRRYVKIKDREMTK